jgi:hypothetical protein
LTRRKALAVVFRHAVINARLLLRAT